VRAVITVAPTVDEAGDAADVKVASALPVVLPFTAVASTPVVPEPSNVPVFVLGVADVMRLDTFATTTVLPAVFGDVGIVPPPVLSGAEPEAFSGEEPTLVTDIVVNVLRFGGCVGTNKLSSEFNPSIASVTKVVSVRAIAPGVHDPSVGKAPGAARGTAMPLVAPTAPEYPDVPTPE